MRFLATDCNRSRAVRLGNPRAANSLLHDAQHRFGSMEVPSIDSICATSSAAAQGLHLRQSTRSAA